MFVEMLMSNLKSTRAAPLVKKSRASKLFDMPNNLVKDDTQVIKDADQVTCPLA